jgi:hypothetical protein
MTSHAARGLCEEIGQLRDDIAEQGRLLRCIDLMVQAIYVELHASNQARQPQE